MTKDDNINVRGAERRGNDTREVVADGMGGKTETEVRQRKARREMRSSVTGAEE